jgi:uncharacterized protein
MDKLRVEVAKHFNKSSHIAHGFDHAERVASLAKYIAEKEGYDKDEAEIAALLHDIGRTVQEEERDHGPAGVPLATEILNAHTEYDADTKLRILHAIRDHSNFKAEGKLTHIVQDADKLDGLGAIGLMRGYTSQAESQCYDPSDIIPTAGKRYATIHHMLAFQMEWFDMMETDTGKRIAKKRHAFMKNFLKTFESEVLGQDYRN